MKKENRPWWWVVGVMSAWMVVGCRTGASQRAEASHTEVAVASPEPVQVAATTPAPEAKTPMSKGIFSTDEHLQPVYFEISHWEVSDNAMAVLKQNAAWLQENPPYLIQVAGYTDTRGSTSKNRTLAKLRAAKVREAYMNLGIPKSRILMTMPGEETPMCEPTAEECLAKSRRVETWIEQKSLAAK